MSGVWCKYRSPLRKADYDDGAVCAEHPTFFFGENGIVRFAVVFPRDPSCVIADGARGDTARGLAGFRHGQSFHTDTRHVYLGVHTATTMATSKRQEDLAIPLPLSHHAYVCIGNVAAAMRRLEEYFVSTLGIAIRGNPDYFSEYYDNFTIDEARRIRRMQEGKSLGGHERLFVIGFQAATLEAQNSLLKMLEEPAGSSRFFITVPSWRSLVPTVRSRMYVIDGGHGHGLSDNSADARHFLEADLPERLSFIKKLVEGIADGTKDTRDAVKLCEAIERVFHVGLDARNDRIGALENVLVAEKYLLGRAASIKLVLEHLACVLPHGTA